jgi:hypothetical protein
MCLAQLWDFYCERKREPVSQDGRVQRFRWAQRVVEKALWARLQKERIRKNWLEGQEQWIKGETFGFTQG